MPLIVGREAKPLTGWRARPSGRRVDKHRGTQRHTDLSRQTARDLRAVGGKLNYRPRLIHGDNTPDQAIKTAPYGHFDDSQSPLDTALWVTGGSTRACLSCLSEMLRRYSWSRQVDRSPANKPPARKSERFTVPLHS